MDIWGEFTSSCVWEALPAPGSILFLPANGSVSQIAVPTPRRPMSAHVQARWASHGVDTLPWEGPCLTGAMFLSEQKEGGLLAGVEVVCPGKTQRLLPSHPGALCLILSQFGNNGEEGEHGG